MLALGLFAPFAAREAPAEPGRASAARRAARWATAASLLPLPIWFVASALLAPAPVWRVEYRESADFSGAGAVVHERELQRYWDKSNRRVPGGLSSSSFAARWDACLALREAREIPFLLAADGAARFALDGVERLRVESARGRRATRGELLRLEAGNHHLQVRLEPRGWPSVALLASFDGAAPRAIGSGELAPGIHTTPPGDGPAPCPPGPSVSD